MRYRAGIIGADFDVGGHGALFRVSVRVKRGEVDAIGNSRGRERSRTKE
jgi:hypothetical protein